MCGNIYDYFWEVHVNIQSNKRRSRKPKNGWLTKMASFQHSKRSSNKKCTVEVRWGIFIENLTVFLLPYYARWSSHSWSLGHLCTNQDTPTTPRLYKERIVRLFVAGWFLTFCVVPWIYSLDSFFHQHLLLYKTDYLYDPHSIPFPVVSGEEVYKQMNHPWCLQC